MTLNVSLLPPALLGLFIMVSTTACDDSNDAGDDTDTGVSTGRDDDTAGDTNPTQDAATTTPPSTATSASTSTTGVDPTDATDTAQTTAATDPADTDDPDTTGETEADPTQGASCSEAIACEDEMVLDLGLIAGSSNGGGVENTADGDDWVSRVDATAGGVQNAPNTPWLYLRFTDSGLEAVNIDDLQALESSTWDIAAKRFGIRVNSGSSGPSCVLATAVEGTYAEVDASVEATPNPEDFYDDACNLQDDGSGIGAPNYALTPWWFYPGCVGTTGAPFVIELDDGTRIKFMVESYYAEGQAACNESGAMGSGSANYVWRWARLE